MSPAKKCNWYFTLGHGHEHFPGYVKIYGTFESARDEMIRRHGQKWCWQYSESQAERAIFCFDNIKEVK